MAASTSSGTRQGAAPVLLIGIGGSTSSGKSTLAAYLSSLLNAAYDESHEGKLCRPEGGHGKVEVVGQDDFALPEEELRYDERIDGKDWDDADQCIDYARFANALEELKAGARPPVSPKEVSTLPEVPLPNPSASESTRHILHLLGRLGHPKIFLVDGFLLYYDARVRNTLDIKLFLRASETDVRSRREGRIYHTAEGTTWSDPPNYFDLILWPSYVKAHKGLFVNQDVEQGEPAAATGSEGDAERGGPVKGLRLLETKSQSLEDVVRNACRLLEEELQVLVEGKNSSS